MLLQYGNTDALVGKEWYLLELRSEKTIESTIRRVGSAVPSIFCSDPLEIFIPVSKRGLDTFELSTGPYLFVRSTNFQSLLRLKTITGVVALSTEGDSNRPSKAIKVEDSYVQSLIVNAEEEFRNRAVGIETGSFVRVLNGDTRDYCGVVEAVGSGRAIVRINLKTKSIILETPLRNLLNLSHVPENLRVYYYCPLVEELVKEYPDGFSLIEEDLKSHKPMLAIPDICEKKPLDTKKHSRQRTVTALVKKLIFIDSEHDPFSICKNVIAAIQRNEIRCPKTYFIICCIVKDNLLRNYFQQIDPNIVSYRDVISKYGKDYKITAQQIAEIDHSLKIPVLSSTGVRPKEKIAGTPKRRGRPRKSPSSST